MHHVFGKHQGLSLDTEEYFQTTIVIMETMERDRDGSFPMTPAVALLILLEIVWLVQPELRVSVIGFHNVDL